jgi:hypothetical protein
MHGRLGVVAWCGSWVDPLTAVGLNLLVTSDAGFTYRYQIKPTLKPDFATHGSSKIKPKSSSLLESFTIVTLPNIGNLQVTIPKPVPVALPP